MKNNIITWVEIYVEDMERAKKFYKDVFGQELQAMPMEGSTDEMYAFAWEDDAPGAAGALIKSETRKPSDSGTLAYFGCSNCDELLLKVESAGGKVLMPMTDAGEFGTFAQFTDTEGNTIGVFASNETGAES